MEEPTSTAGSTPSPRPAPTEWRVEAGGTEVTARCEPALSVPAATLVLAHGAGGHMHDRGMTRTAELLRAIGTDVVRFNFPYSEQRSRRPDPMPTLKSCYRAVVARARHELNPELVIVGGRSMGGRVGSMLAAEGLACDALLLLAYPLHPAGKPEQLRDAHLPGIQVPVLCINGTRDALCRRDLMEPVLERLGSQWTMHWVEGADHSFHVLKSSGRTDADVLGEIGERTSAWLRELAQGSS